MNKLPTSPAARKSLPVTTGVLDYFPLALLEVAHASKAGNDQHNHGQPLHWAKEKSTDHADALTRHLMERGTVDTDGVLHSAKVAWRALALLQTELEAMPEEDDDVVAPKVEADVPVTTNTANAERDVFAIAQLAADLRASFDWGKTPQGREYWAAVKADLDSLPYECVLWRPRTYEELAEDLNLAFPWDSTPQGHLYWMTVHDQLRALANPEDE